MSEIKAIETRYKGYRFRSRVEARWAVFFDAMGMKWDYESEGFDLGGLYYLPDFKIETHGWVEIKKTHNISLDEREKIIRFGKAMDESKYGEREDFSVIIGDPWAGGEWDFSYGAFSSRQFNCNVSTESQSCGHWHQCPLCSRVSLTWADHNFDGENNSLNCLWCDIWDRDQKHGKQIHADATFHKGVVICPKPFPHNTPTLQRAYAAARSARFEHGESPRF